jgi:hypothetical protein
MKYAALFIAALLAGLVLGAWGPKTDLKKAKQELADLRKQLGKKGQGRSSLQGVAAILPMPEQARNAPGSAPRHGPALAVATSPAPDAATTTTATRVHRFAGTGATNTTFKERIQTAADLWKIRVDLARSVYLSNVKPDEKQTERFDVIMEAMNLRLGDSIGKWVDEFKEQGEIKPEGGLRMMNELSGIVVLTYDELDRSMPTNWRTNAGDGFQVFDFIDPEVAMPLAEIDTLMQTNAPPPFAVGGERRHRPAP